MVEITNLSIFYIRGKAVIGWFILRVHCFLIGRLEAGKLEDGELLSDWLVAGDNNWEEISRYLSR